MLPLAQLVGDLGKKNGEKKLRALIARTPEWCSQTSRAYAASKCPSRSRLAKVLKSRLASELRKSDLLFLSRVWRFKSSVWRWKPPKPEKQPKRIIKSKAAEPDAMMAKATFHPHPGAAALATGSSGLEKKVDEVGKQASGEHVALDLVLEK